MSEKERDEQLLEEGGDAPISIDEGRAPIVPHAKKRNPAPESERKEALSFVINPNQPKPATSFGPKNTREMPVKISTGYKPGEKLYTEKGTLKLTEEQQKELEAKALRNKQTVQTRIVPRENPENNLTPEEIQANARAKLIRGIGLAILTTTFVTAAGIAGIVGYDSSKKQNSATSTVPSADKVTPPIQSPETLDAGVDAEAKTEVSDNSAAPINSTQVPEPKPEPAKPIQHPKTQTTATPKTDSTSNPKGHNTDVVDPWAVPTSTSKTKPKGKSKDFGY